jgi:hypothetical protein
MFEQLSPSARRVFSSACFTAAVLCLGLGASCAAHAQQQRPLPVTVELGDVSLTKLPADHHRRRQRDFRAQRIEGRYVHYDPRRRCRA